MKTLFRTVLAASVLAAVSIGSANAKSDSGYQARHALQHSIYNLPSVDVTVNDGIATLIGNVENATDKNQIERIVLNTEGVTGVVNLISTN